MNWVAHNYLRSATHAAANTRLVDYHTPLPLAQAWGGGEMASADGMRFVIPVSTIHAAYNPRYFGRQRGSTLYSWMADTYTVFAQKLIPGTQRDSLHVLDGLIANQTGIRPEIVSTDTAGASEIVFALAWALGYRWAPRLADLPDQRLWRIDRHAHYGPLNGLARNHINTRLIAENWDEICRLTASLRAGTVVPSAILRTLQRGPGPSSLARALAELGRVIKTLHVLEYVHDPAYRRTIHHLLSQGERRNSLARDVFHGQRGQLRKHYQVGQENQLDSLGIMINIIVLWQTVYTQAALDHLAANGYPLDPADIARLYPARAPHDQSRRPVPDHQPTTHHRTPAATNRLTQDPAPILVTGQYRPGPSRPAVATAKECHSLSLAADPDELSQQASSRERDHDHLAGNREELGRQAAHAQPGVRHQHNERGQEQHGRLADQPGQARAGRQRPSRLDRNEDRQDPQRRPAAEPVDRSRSGCAGIGAPGPWRCAPPRPGSRARRRRRCRATGRTARRAPPRPRARPCPRSPSRGATAPGGRSAGAAGTTGPAAPARILRARFRRAARPPRCRMPRVTSPPPGRRPRRGPPTTR